MRTTRSLLLLLFTAALIGGTAAPAAAQAQDVPQVPPCAPAAGLAGNGTTAGAGASGAAGNGTATNGAAAPEASDVSAYVIGADDILTVRFWRDDTMSGDFVVRPDGKISLPLINEINAAGLTPMQLCLAVTEAAKVWLENPTVSVVVKQINSRRVYITGQVGKPGPYAISGRMDVLQLITLAGGLLEFADKKNVRVIRSEGGKTVAIKVNYDDISKGKNLNQIIELRPGDTVIVR